MAATLLPEIDTDACTGCGDCVAVCPTGALAMAGGKAVMPRPDLCIYDGECEPVCSVGAIQIPYVIVLG
jgi:NAD-dependent dihydropyrimidine dehydrogenase PreA subunit